MASVCLFVCLCVCVCLFVCQHDNFRTTKLMMMKFCTKISAEFEFGGHSPWARTPKNVALGYDIGKISAGCLIIFYCKWANGSRADIHAVCSRDDPVVSDNGTPAFVPPVVLKTAHPRP